MSKKDVKNALHKLESVLQSKYKKRGKCMKLICDGLDLADAVLKVIKATATKTTNPVLEGIKLVAEDECLRLSATDLELMIETTIKADVKLEGTAVVPGKFFSEYVRKLTNEQITLETCENNQLKLSYTDSEGFMQCLNAEEFPNIQKISNDEYFEIDKKEFVDAINKTIFSVSLDDSRPLFKGCYFEVSNDTLTVVALDGYRMSVVKKEIAHATSVTNFVVPAKSLSEITKVVDDKDENIKIYFQKQFVMIEQDGAVIISRLLDGEFINYKNLITQGDFTTVATANKKQLEEALDRTSLLARVERNNIAKFEIKDKTLGISSNSEIGNIHENVTISLSGADLVTAFNSRYFIECLKVINNEFINLNFTTAIAPCIIKPCEGEEFLFLILPVRIIN